MVQRVRLDHGARIRVPSTGRARLPDAEAPFDPASCKASPRPWEVSHQPRWRYQQDHSENDEEPVWDRVNNTMRCKESEWERKSRKNVDLDTIRGEAIGEMWGPKAAVRPVQTCRQAHQSRSRRQTHMWTRRLPFRASNHGSVYNSINEEYIITMKQRDNLEHVQETIKIKWCSVYLVNKSRGTARYADRDTKGKQ